MTTRLNAYALIVGCDQYEHYEPLGGAENDARRFRDFLTDPSRGALPAENVIHLRSPSFDEVRLSLKEQAAKVATVRGLLLLYFAGHGILGGREGVQLVFRTTEIDDLTFTALSLRHIAQVLSEHKIISSVTVLDICHSGAHSSGAAELSLNQLWGGDEVLAEGHFILAACGPNEVARENFGGGKFTSLLFEQVDHIGRERSFEAEIAVETLANSIVNASQGMLKQKPTWTGIAISKQVVICRNPHWDPSAARPPGVLSFESIPDVDREALLPATRAYIVPMLRVGTRQNWTRDAQDILFQVANSSARDDSKQVILGRLAEAIFDRVDGFGDELDIAQLMETIPAAVVALGQSNGLEGEAIRMLAYRLTQLAPQFCQFLAEWQSAKAWLVRDDGPASIALAPIRFWDMLGRAALLALACAWLKMEKVQADLTEQILDAVRLSEGMYRLEWAGQYPDICAVVGHVFLRDKDLARNIITNILDNYVKRAAQGELPAPARLAPRELGKFLAKKYSKPTDSVNSDVSFADEGPALLLLMLASVGVPRLELDSRVGALTMAKGLGDYCLYVPNSMQSQFTMSMLECDVRMWIRASGKSIASMLDDFERLACHPLSDNPVQHPMESFVSYSAGRLYRNRACHYVFTSLVARARA